MDIEIKCYNCDKVMNIENSTMVPGADTIRFEVTPCQSPGCTNCKDCEDMELLKKVQEELKQVKLKLAAHEAIP